MVVDSRYTKVAKGKSRLSILILSQAVVQFLGALLLFYSYLMEEHIDQLAVLSTSIYFLSLLIGELATSSSTFPSPLGVGVDVEAGMDILQVEDYVIYQVYP
ncbi:hypothetical protein POM88_007186 [Heracleum sosnowskyi]|uniref:Uncharacterized protein n=1 Tax=Heracleum sosnowskyi TaxID=360622 RepID=A0AAD8N7B2_9APIA|nr:hypothetical protein POM88_007186 [Heracleum sosnowskyi]